MAKDGKLETLADKLKDGDRDSRRIVFGTDWNDFRLMFKIFAGAQDRPGLGELEL